MELTLQHKLVQAYLHGRERPDLRRHSRRILLRPGGDYAMFAGEDASRVLAKMSKDEGDVVGSLHGLSDKEIGVLTMIGRRSSKLSTQLLAVLCLELVTWSMPIDMFCSFCVCTSCECDQ
ncbi:hypothetical protein Vadar_004270 [Vaccinium darrowii]|uniref:Uncharacterized protein n=1 Tax=Vaccinium darrowii TaxID=229202 RepID=A0ACB7WXX7_9ERIC|nr:hypothetical protein Vadar_004270 [Vaccinium darrowii]